MLEMRFTDLALKHLSNLGFEPSPDRLVYTSQSEDLELIPTSKVAINMSDVEDLANYLGVPLRSIVIILPDKICDCYSSNMREHLVVELYGSDGLDLQSLLERTGPQCPCGKTTRWVGGTDADPRPRCDACGAPQP